jgi:hypothetical protein
VDRLSVDILAVAVESDVEGKAGVGEVVVSAEHNEDRDAAVGLPGQLGELPGRCVLDTECEE